MRKLKVSITGPSRARRENLKRLDRNPGLQYNPEQVKALISLPSKVSGHSLTMS